MGNDTIIMEGKVGIGVFHPTEELHVGGDALVTGTLTVNGVATLPNLILDKVRLTPEGGIAVKLVNKTGSTTVKGSVVSPTSTASAFTLSPVDSASPIGIVYDAGIADAAEAWVVIAGIAEVLFIGATVLGHFARVCVTGDTNAAAGKAISEAAPTSPFATDKHFQEIGHVIQARADAGLAKVVVHFN